MLNEVVSVTGWSRDNARRRLVAAAKAPPGSGRTVARTERKPRGRGYSYDALLVLRQVWAASGGQCGKYLAASMRIQLDLLEAHGELVRSADADPAQGDRARYDEDVRAELLTMSAATIDRYLKPSKAEPPQVWCRILVSWKDANHAEEDRPEGQGALRAAGAGAFA